jgi:hypothetical protein
LIADRLRAKLGREEKYRKRMTVRNNLGDLPTMKLSEEELARYAREADQRVVQADSAAQRATFRPAPPSYPDIDVSVEVADVSFEGFEAVMQAERLQLESSPPPGLPPAPDADSAGEDPHSDVRLAVAGEPGPNQEPPLSSVPCVVASKEDLSWFELEDASHVVLDMIDGESTVESIVSTLTIPRANALAILRELRAHGVIEFH